MKYLPTILLIFLSGCSATGPLFKQELPFNTEEAVVYFFRPDTLLLSGVGAFFLIDDEEVSKLKRNGYSFHYVRPGIHVIGMSWNCVMGACSKVYGPDYTSMQNKPKIEVHIGPGEQRFFKLTIDNYVGDINWGFKEIDKTEALKEIVNARFDNDL